MQPERLSKKAGDEKFHHRVAKSKPVKPESIILQRSMRNVLAVCSLGILLLIPLIYVFSGSLKHLFLTVAVSGLCYAIASHININIHNNSYFK